MVLWQSPDTPVMSCFHVNVRGFDCARAVRSLVCVPCFVLERGVRIPALMSWDSVFVSGFEHSRSIFCHCVSARSQVRSTARSPCPRVFCCVACSSCFYRLRAFMLYLVLCGTQLVYFIGCMLSCCHVLCWTHGLWVFSLAACSCLVLHMACELFAGHALVFLFCVSTWLLS